jgi:hypothetical protein
MTENYIFTAGNKRKLLDTVTKKDLEKGNLDTTEAERKDTHVTESKESTPSRNVREILKINKNAYAGNGDPMERIQAMLDQKRELEEIPRYSESKSGKVGTLRISMSPRVVDTIDTKLLVEKTIEPVKETGLSEESKPKEEVTPKLEEKKIDTGGITFFNPFTAKDKDQALNTFTNTAIQNTNVNSLFPATTNPNNPFLTKPGGFTFNINLNFAKVNQTTEDGGEDSDGEDFVNPEEEVEIKPGSKSNPSENAPKVNPNLFYKLDVDTFSVYDYNEKKYIPKGKGTVCFEYADSERKIGFCVFRTPLAVLFQGRVIPNTSSLEVKFHNYKYNIVLQKLAQKISDKVQISAVRTQLVNENQADEFETKFNEFVKSIN